MLDRPPLEVAPWFHCTNCRAVLFHKGDDGFELFFGASSGACPKCHSKVDLWAVFLDAVTKHFMLTGAFVALGATSTVFSFSLAANETKELIFADYGVPATAAILSLNYTPQGGGCFPMEVHGNTPRRGPLHGRVHVFGRPMQTMDGQDGAPINCFITWMSPPDEDDGWTHLIDAYRAYDDKNWRGVVIPANVAAESSISKAAFDLVQRHASKKSTEAFLTDAATYAHQLKVVIPLGCALAGIEQLSPQIRGHLDRLRKLRNKLAHTGSTETVLDQSRAAELLVAATFGFRYGRYFRRELARKQKDNSPE